MYPLRLEVTHILKVMAKKTSGKRISIRAPGRRKFKTGPRPRLNKIKEKQTEKLIKGRLEKKQTEKMIKGPLGKKQIEKMIKNRLKEKQTEKMFQAFHGWKRLHHQFNKLKFLGACSCAACLVRVASCKA